MHQIFYNGLIEIQCVWTWCMRKHVVHSFVVNQQAINFLKATTPFVYLSCCHTC